jgi:hypothetical protein
LPKPFAHTVITVAFGGARMRLTTVSASRSFAPRTPAAGRPMGRASSDEKQIA